MVSDLFSSHSGQVLGLWVCPLVPSGVAVASLDYGSFEYQALYAG